MARREVPAERVILELTTKGFELFGQLAEPHPVTESQGDGVGRELSGSGRGETPVKGVGLTVPAQLTPPTTWIELACMTAPPFPTMAALGSSESTDRPQFPWTWVLPLWQ